MKYIKQEFKDRILNDDGSIKQEGTVLSAFHLNYIEEGIETLANEVTEAVVKVEDLNDDVEQLYLDLENLNNATGLGDVSQITGSIGWIENAAEVLYANGKFTGSGYYNETVIINGYTMPVLKSRMPSKIDGVEFYIRAQNNEDQILNVFVGYTPSITSSSGMVKVKEATFTVPLTTSFQKYSFPLEVTKADLSAVADDGMFIVGYYPPEEDKAKPIGCGNISTSDEGYVETVDHKGFYYYNNKFLLNSSKQPWYVSFYKQLPPTLKTALTREDSGYRAHEDGKTFYLDNLRVDGVDASIDMIKVPQKYDLVVGDTFELFWNGIMLCKDYTKYNIEAKSSINGHNYRHKFEITPSTAGTYPLTITVFDDAGKQIDSKTTQLIVKPALTQGPSAPINIVCIGASDTNDKAWPDEFARRICGTTTKTNYPSINSGNGPQGLGLTNINFVGTKTTPGGYGYEGTGGWTWDSYMNLTQSGDWYITLSTPHTKELEDQESVYRDSNGKEWQLETLISETRLMMKPFGSTTADDTMPASGTLTYVSGGEDFTNLEYSSCERGSVNPFAYGGKMDFKKYCERVGVDKIDYLFGLLVFNGAPSSVNKNTMDTRKAKIVKFYDYLKADYPDAKLIIMDSYLPCYDGCGVNYTSNSHYGNNFRTLQEWAFAQIEINQQLKDEYPGKVDYVSLAGIFDAEHNFPTTSVQYNNRNTSAKFNRQNNGLHPITNGHFQSADALFRFLNNELQ